MAWGFLLLVLPLLLLSCHPRGGSGALIIDGEGVRIEPLFGARRFAERAAWVDIRYMALLLQGSQATLCIVRHDGRVLRWLVSVFGPVDAIVAAIHARAKPGPEVLSDCLLLPARIGQRPLHVIGVAAVCLLLTQAAERWLLTAWHVATDSAFAPALVTVPLAIVGAGLWIWRDRTAYRRLPAAALSGLLLGLVLNFTVLTSGRLLTEAGWRHEVRAEFRLNEVEAQTGIQSQRWRPLDPQAWRFRDGHFRVDAVWPGYTGTLQSGRTYRLTVWRGAANDIAFPPAAFRTAERVE